MAMITMSHLGYCLGHLMVSTLSPLALFIWEAGCLVYRLLFLPLAWEVTGSDPRRAPKMKGCCWAVKDARTLRGEEFNLGPVTRLTTSASTQVAVLWAWQRAGALGFPRLPGKINSCSWLELWSLSQELFKTPSRLNDYNRAPPKHADIYFSFELIIYRALFIVFT